MTMPFGKYKGRELSEVATTDPGYLEWLTGQGWFEQKYGNLFQTVITNNYYNEPAETPDHNAMQVRFLDKEYRNNLRHNILPKKQWDIYYHTNRRNVVRKLIKELRLVRDGFDPDNVHYRMCEGPEYKKVYGEIRESKAREKEHSLLESIQEVRNLRYVHHMPEFEAHGWDVVFYSTTRLAHWTDNQNSTIATYLIECKPSLGDDYPAVLRQMEKQWDRFSRREKYRKRHHLVCLVGEYTGRGATWEQVQQIFDSKGFHLILEVSIL